MKKPQPITIEGRIKFTGKIHPEPESESRNRKNTQPRKRTETASIVQDKTSNLAFGLNSDFFI